MMKRAIVAATLALAVFIGLSFNWTAGDSHFGVANRMIRHWSLVPELVIIKPACAAGFNKSSGGPCGGGGGGAGTYTLAGPSTLMLNVTTANYTVQPVGSLGSPVTVTPTDGGHGGIFSPTSITMSGAGAQTFTYTPLQTGSYTIATTNGGGLTNPSAISVSSPNAAPGYPAMAGGTWGNNNDSTFTTGAAGDPFGGSNTASIQEGSATNFHSAITQATFAVTSGQQYTVSFFIKNSSGSRKLDYWLMSADFSTALGGSFDPAACSFLGDQSFGGPTIASTATRVVGSWCLVQYTGTLGAFTAADIQIFLDTGAALNYAGDGTSKILLYGPVVQ
jgi:hypothetical protein